MARCLFLFLLSPLPLSGDGISLCSLRQTQAHNLPVSQMLGLQASVTMAFSLRCFLQNRDWCVPRSYANLGWSWGAIKAPASAPALRKECCPGCGQPSHTELTVTDPSSSRHTDTEIHLEINLYFKKACRVHINSAPSSPSSHLRQQYSHTTRGKSLSFLTVKSPHALTTGPPLQSQCPESSVISQESQDLSSFFSCDLFSFALQLGLDWYSVCSPGWPQTHSSMLPQPPES